ncbi:ferric-chelate reductase [Dendryphion nanum]|uniref:ferric-chelate reductase (NADPH) n=1 Tax=Dendryphion nanum TaxID=256645 RepID=A0A9P9DD21_9PLEO|nr:ferric-chelate reductase [Dendryphion nanum]
MAHNHGGGSTGALPLLVEFPKFYWAVVGVAVGVATLVNIVNIVIYRQRLSAARAGAPLPAKPKSLFFSILATTYAITREASSYAISIPVKSRIIRLPTFGRGTLVVANLVVVLVLCLYGLDLKDQWSREEVGYRCGVITIAQIPLLFLLAGKNNIIGFLTGISHERLNWLHRWFARCMLLTATIHMGYFFGAWAPFDYIGTQIKQNSIVQKGMVAWALLVWIVFSSMTPIRGWCYELFVLQHLISFAVFIGFVYIHTPAEVHGYIWAPVALFWLDRAIRIGRTLYANLSIFHPKQRAAGQMSGVWACKAEFIPLPHQTTRIIIHNPPIKWTPGQHMFLSCHSIVPLQSHPFTVASIPADGRMEFLVKSETGGTRHFFRHAEKTHGLPASSSASCTRTVAIEGPYGCLRPLRQFDSVVLLAGSTGATFTVPLLRDLIQGWKENVNPPAASSLFKPQTGAVTRSVRFVWIVKSRGQLGWFSEQLSSVYTEFLMLQDQLKHIKLEIVVCITCDDSFTDEHRTLLSTISAPNPNADKARPQAHQHGKVELVNQTTIIDEKTNFNINEKGSELSTTDSRNTGETGDVNSPTSTCGCKNTISDTNSPDAVAQCSCCNPTVLKPSTPPLSSILSPTKQAPIHPAISVLSGRPNPENIIRKMLEQALGESAVVVCGPQGLVADVKRDVVALSDERAVHKGTGAQGIYLHTESFGY